MKTWEDIIKERMVGYESPLPEGCFAEFQAMRDKAGRATPFKRIWPILIASAAAAAGVSAFLYFRNPDVREEGLPAIPQTAGEVAVKPATPLIDEMLASNSIADVISDVNPPKERTKTSQNTPSETQNYGAENNVAHTCVIHAADTVGKGEDKRATVNSVAKDTKTQKRENLATPVMPDYHSDKSDWNNDRGIKPPSFRRNIYGSISLAAGQLPYVGGSTIISPNSPTMPPQYSHTHYLPIKAGLSATIPLSERISITSGVDYSLYTSSYTYRISSSTWGENIQYAHYLGIPLSLNWKFASTKAFDFYIGTGAEIDFFMGATLAGSHINRDGGIFSLMGTGGMQWNISKQIGLYLEPSINWATPSSNRIMETYLTEHPLTFLVAAGLRFNFLSRD